MTRKRVVEKKDKPIIKVAAVAVPKVVETPKPKEIKQAKPVKEEKVEKKEE